MMPATNDNLHGNVLSLLPPSEVEARVPLLATASDIRELIQYLKLKPNGVVAAEELDRPKRHCLTSASWNWKYRHGIDQLCREGSWLSG